ncbi:MAG: hypothetical protein EBS18_05495 [Actinobacteria bacterium]|nr:hypothetical protein [Actinomycetota bacterium]
MTKAEKTAISKEYTTKIMSSPTVDSTVIKNANQFAKNFDKQVTDVASLNNFRRGLDKNAINYVKNPDAATTAKAEAATVMRRVASDNISKVAPVLKEVNTKYSNLNRAGDYLTQQAGRITRQGENAGAGLSGRILTGDVAQTVKSKSGALMQQAAAAKPSSTAAGRLTGLTAREGIKQSIGQAAVPAAIPALALPKPEPTQTQDLTSALQQAGGMPGATGMTGMGMQGGMGGADMNAPQQPMMSPQDLLAAVQANPKQASTYISLYKALQEAGGGKVTAAQQKQQMGVQAASSLVDNLENQLKNLPSGRIGGAAAKAQGFVMGSPTNAYEQGRAGYALMLIKQIQGSAGQISDADRQAIVSYVPSVMDTMQERRFKIQQLRNIIDSYSGAANANYGSQNTYDMSGMQ